MQLFNLFNTFYSNPLLSENKISSNTDLIMAGLYRHGDSFGYFKWHWNLLSVYWRSTKDCRGQMKLINIMHTSKNKISCSLNLNQKNSADSQLHCRSKWKDTRMKKCCKELYKQKLKINYLLAKKLV